MVRKKKTSFLKKTSPLKKTHTFESLDPRTGNVLARYPKTSPEEVFEIVDLAHDAAQVWQSLGYTKRKKVLLAWAAHLVTQMDVGAQIIADETGKPLSDAKLEVGIAIDHISWAAKNARSILETSYRPSGLLMFNMSSRVERSPYGVIGVIGPWNYPLFTPMGSIAYALAAGNAVVFKPSEYTPGVGVWIAETFEKFAPCEFLFTTVTGLPETGQALTESAVDKISFTGSTRTAKKVAASCAQRMVPTILECGGKDAMLVDRDADLARAADGILWSAMANAGQSCIGAERVYVHQDVSQKFKDLIVEKARDLKPGVNYGPATMPTQLAVIDSHIKDAAKRGGKFLVGDKNAVKAPYVSPVIMEDVPEDSLEMTDETFGPTLVINTVKTMSEAILLANNSRYGLGASVWSKRNGNKIASQLRTGMVSVNSVFTFAAVPSVPFGGVQDSGSGRIHGPEGLLEMTYPRTVVKTRFTIPLVFTSFKRSAGADRLIMKLIRTLHGRRF